MAVPKIRFPEFTDDWEQRKVGDITIESTEYTTLDAGYPLTAKKHCLVWFQSVPVLTDT